MKQPLGPSDPLTPSEANGPAGPNLIFSPISHHFISEYMFLREDFLLELELEIINQSLQRKGQSTWPVLLTMHNWPMG